MHRLVLHASWRPPSLKIRSAISCLTQQIRHNKSKAAWTGTEYSKELEQRRQAGIRRIQQMKIKALYRDDPASARDFCKKNKSWKQLREEQDLRKQSPLRILFCGGDQWSAGILKRGLCKFMRKEEYMVESIDVVVKKADRREKPAPIRADVKKLQLGSAVDWSVKEAALEQKLPIHEIESFDAFELPSRTTPSSPDIPVPPNLVITAAFPMLIPQRILDEVEFGGINIHPGLIHGDRPQPYSRQAKDWHLNRFDPMVDPKPPFANILSSQLSSSGVALQLVHADGYLKGGVLRQWKLEIPQRKVKSMHLLNDLIKKFVTHGANILREQFSLGVYKTLKNDPHIVGGGISERHVQVMKKIRPKHLESEEVNKMTQRHAVAQ